MSQDPVAHGRSKAHGARGTIKRAVAFSIAGASCLAISSCGGSGTGNNHPPGQQGGFNKASLLTAIADCTLARVKAFPPKAVALKDATAAYAADRSAANRLASREAWRQAMATWQEAEMFSYGPAAPTMEPGGKGLRDQIYAWPLFSRCQVEEQLVSQAYNQPAFATSPINGRGLAAVEYLLFYEGSDNSCSQFSPINGNGTWAALGAEELTRRKAEYAAAAAKLVADRAAELETAWDPAAGNFRNEVASAGAGSVTFKTDQDALNAVSTAMFYLERYVKDFKAGRPAGLYECFMMSCPEGIESRYARVSTEHMRANLAAFRRLFEGCDAPSEPGFDDWLRAVGKPDLVDRTIAATNNITTELDRIGSFEDAIVSNLPAAQELHASLKGVTDLIKSEFITVLDLELPRSVEGDND